MSENKRRDRDMRNSSSAARNRTDALQASGKAKFTSPQVTAAWSISKITSKIVPSKLKCRTCELAKNVVLKACLKKCQLIAITKWAWYVPIQRGKLEIILMKKKLQKSTEHAFFALWLLVITEHNLFQGINRSVLMKRASFSLRQSKNLVVRMLERWHSHILDFEVSKIKTFDLPLKNALNEDYSFASSCEQLVTVQNFKTSVFLLSKRKVQIKTTIFAGWSSGMRRKNRLRNQTWKQYHRIRRRLLAKTVDCWLSSRRSWPDLTQPGRATDAASVAVDWCSLLWAALRSQDIPALRKITDKSEGRCCHQGLLPCMLWFLGKTASHILRVVLSKFFCVWRDSIRSVQTIRLCATTLVGSNQLELIFWSWAKWTRTLSNLLRACVFQQSASASCLLSCCCRAWKAMSDCAKRIRTSARGQVRWLFSFWRQEMKWIRARRCFVNRYLRCLSLMDTALALRRTWLTWLICHDLFQLNETCVLRWRGRHSLRIATCFLNRWKCLSILKSRKERIRRISKNPSMREECFTPIHKVFLHWVCFAREKMRLRRASSAIARYYRELILSKTLDVWMYANSKRKTNDCGERNFTVSSFRQRIVYSRRCSESNLGESILDRDLTRALICTKEVIDGTSHDKYCTIWRPPQGKQQLSSISFFTVAFPGKEQCLEISYEILIARFFIMRKFFLLWHFLKNRGFFFQLAGLKTSTKFKLKHLSRCFLSWNTWVNSRVRRSSALTKLVATTVVRMRSNMLANTLEKKKKFVITFFPSLWREVHSWDIWLSYTRCNVRLKMIARMFERRCQIRALCKSTTQWKNHISLKKLVWDIQVLINTEEMNVKSELEALDFPGEERRIFKFNLQDSRVGGLSFQDLMNKLSISSDQYELLPSCLQLWEAEILSYKNLLEECISDKFRMQDELKRQKEAASMQMPKNKVKTEDDENSNFFFKEDVYITRVIKRRVFNTWMRTTKSNQNCLRFIQMHQAKRIALFRSKLFRVWLRWTKMKLMQSSRQLQVVLKRHKRLLSRILCCWGLIVSASRQFITTKAWKINKMKLMPKVHEFEQWQAFVLISRRIKNFVRNKMQTRAVRHCLRALKTWIFFTSSRFQQKSGLCTKFLDDENKSLLSKSITSNAVKKNSHYFECGSHFYCQSCICASCKTRFKNMTLHLSAWFSFVRQSHNIDQESIKLLRWSLKCRLKKLWHNWIVEMSKRKILRIIFWRLNRLISNNALRRMCQLWLEKKNQSKWVWEKILQSKMQKRKSNILLFLSQWLYIAATKKKLYCLLQIATRRFKLYCHRAAFVHWMAITKSRRSQYSKMLANNNKKTNLLVDSNPHSISMRLWILNSKLCKEIKNSSRRSYSVDAWHQFTYIVIRLYVRLRVHSKDFRKIYLMQILPRRTSNPLMPRIRPLDINWSNLWVKTKKEESISNSRVVIHACSISLLRKIYNLQISKAMRLISRHWRIWKVLVLRSKYFQKALIQIFLRRNRVRYHFCFQQLLAFLKFHRVIKETLKKLKGSMQLKLLGISFNNWAVCMADMLEISLNDLSFFGIRKSEKKMQNKLFIEWQYEVQRVYNLCEISAKYVKHVRSKFRQSVMFDARNQFSKILQQKSKVLVAKFSPSFAAALRCSTLSRPIVAFDLIQSKFFRKWRLEIHRRRNLLLAAQKLALKKACLAYLWILWTEYFFQHKKGMHICEALLKIKADHCVLFVAVMIWRAGARWLQQRRELCLGMRCESAFAQTNAILTAWRIVACRRQTKRLQQKFLRQSNTVESLLHIINIQAYSEPSAANLNQNNLQSAGQ